MASTTPFLFHVGYLEHGPPFTRDHACATERQAIEALDTLVGEAPRVWNLSFLLDRSTPTINALITTLLERCVEVGRHRLPGRTPRCRIELGEECLEVSQFDVAAWSNSTIDIELIAPFSLQHVLVARGMRDDEKNSVQFVSSHARDPLGRMLRALGTVTKTKMRFAFVPWMAPQLLDSPITHGIAHLTINDMWGGGVDVARKLMRTIPAREIRVWSYEDSGNIARIGFDMARLFATHVYGTETIVENGFDLRHVVDWIAPFVAFVWGASQKSSVAAPAGDFVAKDGDRALGFRIRSFLEPEFYHS